MSQLPDVAIKYSRGYGKDGRVAAYVRPFKDCFNKSRKISSHSDFDLKLRIAKCIYRWYTPMLYWRVENPNIVSDKPIIIGASTKLNALMEWRRVCNKEDVGKSFEITQIE